MKESTPPPTDPKDRVWFAPPGDTPPASFGPSFGRPELGPGSAPGIGPAASGPRGGAPGPVPQMLPTEDFVFNPGGKGLGFGMGDGPLRTILSILVVLAVIGGGLVFWFARSGGGGVALALEMPSGQRIGYTMTMSMQGTISIGNGSQPVDVSAKGRIGWTVLSVDSDGVATVELRFDQMSVAAGGKSVKTKPTTVTVKISKDGRLLSGTDLSVFGREPSGLPGGSQFVPILPDHPVKPGDSWSEGYEQTNDLGYGSISISATGTLVNFEKDGGHKVAVVQTVETIPIHMTVDLSEVANRFHIGGIPAGSKITYSGSVNVQEYSWVDTVSKQLLKSTSDARFQLDMTFEGFGHGIPDGANVTFDGSMDMSITQEGASVGA